MSARSKAVVEKVDRLMEEASAALVDTRYFECERLASEALAIAHGAADFERMARITLPLQEARRQRRHLAAGVKKIIRIDSYDALEPLLAGGKAMKPGCYLVEPPLVGADGRELRDRAAAEQVPVLVVVREPVTRLGMWPVVAVGPVTVRARITPPKKLDIPWMLGAAESLGDSALHAVDPEESAEDRVDHLLELLAAVIDHERLHQALADACAEAAASEHSERKKAPAADSDDDFDELEEDEAA